MPLGRETANFDQKGIARSRKLRMIAQCAYLWQSYALHDAHRVLTWRATGLVVLPKVTGCQVPDSGLARAASLHKF